MANKRIPVTTLPPNYADGQVLYGSDINQIISVLKAGINANKDDIDQILAGEKEVISAASLEGLQEYALNNIVSENTFGYVFGLSGLKAYIYQGGFWTFNKDLSLIEIFEEWNSMWNAIMSGLSPSVEPPTDPKIKLWAKIIQR